MGVAPLKEVPEGDSEAPEKDLSSLTTRRRQNGPPPPEVARQVPSRHATGSPSRRPGESRQENRGYRRCEIAHVIPAARACRDDQSRTVPTEGPARAPCLDSQANRR